MPIKRYSLETEQDLYAKKTLVEQLRQELELGDQSQNEESAIYLEEVRKRGPLHVYVVWSKWSKHGLLERSEVIMDAMEQAKGFEDDLNRVTLAMGATPDEWKRMGK
jgi:hypothetical protein